MVNLYAVVVTIARARTLLRVGDRLRILMNVAAVLAVLTNHHVDLHLTDLPFEAVDIPRIHLV